jgi:hypothetical protein
MTLSPRLPSGLACDTAGSGPAGAELSRMTELAATRFAAADPDLWIMAGTPRGWAQMTRRLLWSTPWQPGRTLAFAALGTRRAIGLVGAHNLQGLAGATADGGTWTVCDGSIQVAPRDRETTT